jgi:hypothetical protein
MRIDSPSFSGSIVQDRNNAYADLSGSFTGSLTGSFTGEIFVDVAEFTNLTVSDRLTIGTENQNGTALIVSGGIEVSGSINIGPNNAFTIDGVNVLDSAIAFAIALG